MSVRVLDLKLLYSRELRNADSALQAFIYLEMGDDEKFFVTYVDVHVFVILHRD